MRARIPQDMIPGRAEMTVSERAKWNRQWQKLVWSRPKYRWIFGVSFALLLAITGGIGRAFFLQAEKLQDKIIIPVWCAVLSAMLAHLIQYAASAKEMKARIVAAHEAKSSEGKKPTNR